MNSIEDITEAPKVTFRWVYIILPIILLVVAIIITIVFAGKLPIQVAFHFQGDTPDRWLSRGAFLTWMLLPQVLFTLLAFILVRVVMASSRYWQVDNSPLLKVLPVMGNMMALPQLILTFTMLDVFLYNAYKIRLIPVWVFALIIMILGVIVLGTFFVRIIRQTRRKQTKIPRE